MTGENKYYIIKVYENMHLYSLHYRSMQIGRSDRLKNLVSASVLSADMLNLENEVRKLEKNGIDMLHFDVMDGVFVNNITYGLPVLSAIRKITDITLDVHLMITEPLKYVKRFAESGADIISFHIESKSDVMETIKSISKSGAKAAVAIKPGTPAEAVFEYLPYLDMVLVMTVEPGFGGQSFIPETARKVAVIFNKVKELGINIDIQVDGGIDSETSVIAKKAGANVLVSGSCLFSSSDMAQTAKEIKREI